MKTANTKSMVFAYNYIRVIYIILDKISGGMKNVDYNKWWDASPPPLPHASDSLSTTTFFGLLYYFFRTRVSIMSFRFVFQSLHAVRIFA